MKVFIFLLFVIPQSYGGTDPCIASGNCNFTEVVESQVSSPVANDVIQNSVQDSETAHFISQDSCEGSGGVWTGLYCDFPTPEVCGSGYGEDGRCIIEEGIGVVDDSGVEVSAPICTRPIYRKRGCGPDYCSFNNYDNINTLGCEKYKNAQISIIRDQLRPVCDNAISSSKGECTSALNSTKSPESSGSGNSASVAACNVASDINSSVVPSINSAKGSCEVAFNSCRSTCGMTKPAPWGEEIGLVDGAASCDGPLAQSLAQFDSKVSEATTLASQNQNVCDQASGKTEEDDYDDNDYDNDDYSQQAISDTNPPANLYGDDNPTTNPSGTESKSGELGKTLGTLAAIAPAFADSGDESTASNYTDYGSSGKTLSSYEGDSFNAGGPGVAYGQNNTSYGSENDDFIPTKDALKQLENPDQQSNGAQGTLSPGPGGGGGAGIAGAGAPGGAAAAAAAGQRSGRSSAMAKARNLINGHKRKKDEGGPGSGRAGGKKKSPKYMKLAYQNAIKKFGRKTPLKFDGSKYIPDLEAMKASQRFKMRNARAVAMYNGEKSGGVESLDEHLSNRGINPNEKHGIFRTMNIYFRREFKEASQAHGVML